MYLYNIFKLTYMNMFKKLIEVDRHLSKCDLFSDHFFALLLNSKHQIVWHPVFVFCY